MASFGAPSARVSLRETVSEIALVNWYKLLWHVVVEGHAMPAHVESVADQLEYLLHHHPRNDTRITVGMMKVWALCRAALGPSEPVCAYDELLQKGGGDPSFKKNVALLVAGPVADNLVPPMYRILPPFGSAVNTCMLSDVGILHLYALWHLSLLDNLCEMSDTSPVAKKKCLADTGAVFSSQELKRLEAIYCCTHLPAVDIYAARSDENIYTRIKLSSLSSLEQFALSGHLFDFNPAEYQHDVVGYILNLSKKYGLEFCYGDEILWTDGRLLWLMNDLSRQAVSYVCDGTVLFSATLDEMGLEKFTLFLSEVDRSQRTERGE